MIDAELLHVSLNNRISYEDFFKAFKYSDDDTLYFRTFWDKGKRAGITPQCKLKELRQGTLEDLKKANSKDDGVFFVVNGGGQEDKDVKEVRAQFVDFDDFPFIEQIDIINDFPLEPSIIVKTRKSLHCYWLIDKGIVKGAQEDQEIDPFRNIQRRLYKHLGGDRTIQNPSRVMRLYGYEHRKEEPIEVNLIKFDPEIRYNQEELDRVLPTLEELEEGEEVQPTNNIQPGEPVPEDQKIDKGGRHNYILKWICKTISNNNNEFTAETVAELAYNEFLRSCKAAAGDKEATIRRDFLDIAKWKIKKYKDINSDDKVYSKAKRLWEKNNPDKSFKEELNKSVSWKQLKAYYLEHADEEATAGENKQKYNNMSSRDIKKTKKDKLQKIPVEQTLYNAAQYVRSGVFDSDIKYFGEYKDRKTGFKELDKYLTLYPGLCALGGEASIGKTTFIVNLMDNLLKRGESVIFFSLEQLPIEIITKSLARKKAERDLSTNLTNIDIKNGVADAELEEIKEEYAKESENLYIIRGDFMTTGETVRDTVNQFIEQTNKKPIVIIDYLQLLAPPAGYENKSMREYMDQNLKILKAMQKDNELFVMIVSSFNRASYKTIVDYESFKETSMIEATCDYVLGLQLAIQDEDNFKFYYRTGKNGGIRETTQEEKRKMIKEAKQRNPKKIQLVSLKNRNGRQVYKVNFDYFPANDLFMQQGASNMLEGNKPKPINRKKITFTRI